MSNQVKIVLDFGNSESRCEVKFIDTQGEKVTKRYNMSNRFYKMSAGSTIPSATYGPDKTSVIKVEGDYVGYYANGEIVDREYEKLCMKPFPKSPKYSENSALSFALAITKAVKIIAEHNKMDKKDVNVVWNVTTVLPPASCTEKGIALMKEELKKITKVTDVYTEGKTEVETEIKIGDVFVYPEAFTAYVGCIYDKDLQVRKGYEKYADSTVLVLDIGAGTTEILVVDGTEIVDNTKETFYIGGNNVRAKLRKILRAKYEYDQILDSQLEEAMVTGKIQDGAKMLNISKEVMSAKEEVAKSLVDDTQEYLSGVDFSLRKVTGLLPVGGGTLGGETDDIQPISVIIEKFFAEYSPNISTIELPYEEDEKGALRKKDGQPVRISPRDLNIIGASILADLD